MNSKLKTYNNKRNFNKTTEPKGKISKTKNKLHFCVQHHIAKKDHYDLRLESNGVLLSWAIPKGLSYNTKDKRLAVQVENHPLSYRRYEGTIPKGEYGAGTVMLWDEGYYSPLENINKTYKKGYIKFKLNGKRLKGTWTLIKYKDNNWLIIKEKDEYANITNKKYTRSIKTNRTMKEIENNKSHEKTSKKDGIVCGITITNPNKIIYKKPNITKLDIAMYYHKNASKILPHIKNRLLTTIRSPEGENSKKFFKKHFETNPYLGKKTITNKNGTKENYYYITDEKGLIYEVQNNSYEFHVGNSLITDINHPDTMIFDLDPDETINLKKIRECVTDLQNILKKLKLKSYIKTSGGKGYHIIVKLENKITWNKLKQISKKIAEIMETTYPDKYTTNIRKNKRKNKIFIDWLRNTKGSTTVAPYSLRIRKNAPISYPISWNNVNKIKPKEITLTNIQNYKPAKL